MRIIFAILVMLLTSVCYTQSAAVGSDTLSSKACNALLRVDYAKKFTASNKNIASESNARKNIIKGIYSEIQDSFLEKMQRNNFICDEKSDKYLQGLLGEILSKNKITATDYRILLSRDSDANAYNTGDGTIVINYGLFMTIDNEDELVFVISHEIGHQYLSHIKNDIESFAKLSTSEAIIKKTREIQNQKYGKATMAGNLLKNISYQNYRQRRAREFEADSVGFVFYRKTGRNQQAPIQILSKLKDSDLEKDSLTVADYRAIFDKNGYKLKASYFEEEKSLFSQYDNEKRFEVDSLRSHPACQARMDMIGKQVQGKTSQTFTNAAFLTEVKAAAPIQNLYNLYFSENYGLSLYEALKQYKSDSTNPLLMEIIRLNLGKIMAARISYTINRYVPGVDNKENTDSLNRFITLLNNIRISDFETIMNNFKP
jgi:Zn-dependent protease with chaperone function